MLGLSRAKGYHRASLEVERIAMQDLEPLSDQDGIAESLIARICMSKEELHLEVFGQGLQGILPEAPAVVLPSEKAPWPRPRSGATSGPGAFGASPQY